MATSKQEKLITWLKGHPLISRSALCELIGYDRGSLEQALNGGRSIPEKYISAFENELKKYGYKK